VVNNFEIWKESATFEMVTRKGGFSSTTNCCKRRYSDKL